MISTSMSGTNGAQSEKPSFAKIAAAGLKSTSAPSKSSNNTTNTQKHISSSSPQDGGPKAIPPNGGMPSPKASLSKSSAQLPARDINTNELDTLQPEVHVQAVDSLPRALEEPAPGGLLLPSGSVDDTGTQVSSTDSNKPASLDGKSVASGTTFALDEKESLRPDDSASVKAADDEDVFTPPGTGGPGSKIGSDDGVRAFRDQLREISQMQPPGRSAPPQGFAHASKGVLYIPPLGPGVGVIPNTNRTPASPEETTPAIPDAKLREALENPRDRLWVMKLEQDVIDFVKDVKEATLKLPQCNSFYRMLAHRMADYYMLDHLLDEPTTGVRLFRTPHTRLPPPLSGITTPSTAANTPPPSAPQMKILRRGVDNAGSGNGSNFASENGDDSNEDDKKAKLPLSREEREAKYEAARLRIMGAARPSESPEAAKEKEESRSSSAAGKKNKKKPRADDDDDFEARSAYTTNYFTTAFGSDGIASTHYAPVAYNTNPTVQYPGTFDHQIGAPNPQMPLQHSGNQAWAGQAFQPNDLTHTWTQGQSNGYDLPSDFQRSMSFQGQLPAQSPAAAFNSQYPQPYFAAQQGWPQQAYGITPQNQQPPYSFHGFQPSQDAQPYAFGQLPSQTYGRPASKLEHPLPGSYKSKHFNPQSQSFVPSQMEPGNMMSFTPQRPPASINNSVNPNFSSPAHSHRQASASQQQSRSSPFGSPHQGSPALQHSRPAGQPPMTHPLPQPVFSRQHSLPSMPSLPPKPTGGHPQHNPSLDAKRIISSPVAASSPYQSVTAKWGVPASLPAKPPPVVKSEPFAVKSEPLIKSEPVEDNIHVVKPTMQGHRPSYPSAAAMARQSSSGGGGTTFGSMPPSAATPPIVNGSNAAQSLTRKQS